jgi:hypothetical protein
MDQLRMRRHNLYQRCKVDNIALPVVAEEGGGGTDSHFIFNHF